MATIRKRGSVWQVQVRVKGQARNKSFEKKSEAQEWATQIEADFIRRVASTTCSNKVLIFKLIQKYREAIFPYIRGKRPENSRLKNLEETFGAYTISELTTTRLAEYRNKRLKVVGPQTVKHELGLLLRILRLALSEWGFTLPNGIPLVKMPKLPKGRSRRLEDGEEDKLVSELPILQAQMLLFTLETALRRGELCAMRWEHVDLKARLLRILQTKTGAPRVIPLSTPAIRILQALPRNISGKVWEIEPGSVSQAFSRACARCGIEDLRWHDLRHEATTRLIERGLTIPEASLITGHTTATMLERYTHLRPESLLQKLA